MQLSLSLSHSLELQLQVDEASTLTVFPVSETWLRESSDHQNVVERVGGRCAKQNYRSVMDWLFANMFPGCYWFVSAFYEDAAPPLREILTKEQCRQIDCVMLAVLRLAYKDFCEDRKRSWAQVREESDLAFYAAA